MEVLQGVEIKELGIGPLAKVSAALYAVLGLIVGAIFSLVGWVAPSVFEKLQGFPSEYLRVLFQGGVVIIPLLAALSGALLGAAFAWVYNLVARAWGGVLVQIEPAGGRSEIRRLDPLTVARVLGVAVLAYYLVSTAFGQIATAMGAPNAMSAFGAVQYLILVVGQLVATFAGYFVGILAFNFWSRQWGGLMVRFEPAPEVAFEGRTRRTELGLGSFAAANAVVTVVAVLVITPISALAQVGVLGLVALAAIPALIIMVPVAVVMALVAGAVTALLYNLIAQQGGVAIELVVAPEAAPEAPLESGAEPAGF